MICIVVAPKKDIRKQIAVSNLGEKSENEVRQHMARFHVDLEHP
jgi:hypothetical protein